MTAEKLLVMFTATETNKLRSCTAMAKNTVITLIDSLNGKIEDVETVTFFHPMTGQKMTIELDAQNRKSMGTHLERMGKYFDAAEPVEEAKPARKTVVKNTETSKIREWARDNGFQIGDRGRISAEILAAYNAAQEVIAEPVADESEAVSEAEPESPSEETHPVAEVAEGEPESNEVSDQSYTDAEINELLAELSDADK